MLMGASNPFFSAYAESDWLGKGIFLSLFFLSILSWAILIHKGWLFAKIFKLSQKFASLFGTEDPLSIQCSRPEKKGPHPFFEVYKALKQHALQVMNRNHLFSSEKNSPLFLSEADLDLIAAEAELAISTQTKELEKHLFILSTVVTLAPFLGLLGTVWGILLTFAELQSQGGVASHNHAMLAGLAMALATTVVGLIVAIPALVGYNYFRHATKEYRKEMEHFAHRLLSQVELQYRTPYEQKVFSTD